MVVWSGKRVYSYLTELYENRIVMNEKQIQPNGVDLTLDVVYSVKRDKTTSSVLFEEEEGKRRYRLDTGYYLVGYKEVIRIPSNAIGLVFQRSSLMRSGVVMFTSVWDSGYVGKGKSGMYVFEMDRAFEVVEGERIAQLIFVDAEKTELYKGQYQNEGIDVKKYLEESDRFKRGAIKEIEKMRGVLINAV